MLGRHLCRRLFSSSRVLRAASGDGKDVRDSDLRQPGEDDFKNPWKVLKTEFEEDVDALVPRATDVLVVGGGVMGCSVAYWLRKTANLDVTLLERDPTYTQAATPLSVGGIRQQFSEPENIQMSLFAAEFIRNLKEHLSVLDHDPPDVQFSPHGYLVLASEQGAEQLMKNHQTQISHGAEVELLSRKQLKDRWPWMHVDDIELGSYGVSNEGWFDPWLLLSALRRKMLSIGVRIVHGELVGFEVVADGAKFPADKPVPNDKRGKLRGALVRTPNSLVHCVNFAHVVNAAGPWAQAVARKAGIGVAGAAGGIDLPVEKRRRSYFVVRCPPAGLEAPGIDAPWLIDPSGINVRRKDLAGHFIVFQDAPEDASEQEPEVDNLDVDYSFFEENVWASLAHRIPAMNAVKVRSAWSGFYDFNTVDQNLIIGNHPYHKNMIFCNGSSGHGIQHALAIGRAVTELIMFGEYKTIDLSRLSFDRFFREEPIYEKNII